MDLPLVLPMLWMSSPSIFCSITETIANIASIHINNNANKCLKHKLDIQDSLLDNCQLLQAQTTPRPLQTATAAAFVPIPVTSNPPSPLPITYHLTYQICRYFCGCLHLHSTRTTLTGTEGEISAHSRYILHVSISGQAK